MGARSRIISHLGTWDYFGRARAAIDAIDAIEAYLDFTLTHVHVQKTEQPQHYATESVPVHALPPTLHPEK